MSHASVITERTSGSCPMVEINSYKLEKFTKRKGQINTTINYVSGRIRKRRIEGNCDLSSGLKLATKLSTTHDHSHSAQCTANNYKKEPNNTTSQQTAIRTVISRAISPSFKSKKPMTILLLLIIYVCAHKATLELTQPSSSYGVANAVAIADQYQVVGQANEQVQLPCLIGRQLYCGEPYFIAWYKLNSSTKAWTRIEHQTNDQESQQQQQQQYGPTTLSSTESDSLNEHMRFTWSRSSVGRPQQLACDQLLANHAKLSRPRASSTLLDMSNNFECGQLTISQLELFDEGQYKCEITFSESLDYDKCPTTTLSQLNVIALPNEPELLVNGQRFDGQSAGSFKEGAQVKLECQSSGGKPAPRIEWLNVSFTQRTLGGGEMGSNDLPLIGQFGDAQPELEQEDNQLLAASMDPTRTEIQLMRLHWPQKKSFVSETALAKERATLGNSIQWQPGAPITSSSVSISLSRFDLNSRFFCLVLPSASNNNQQQQLYTEQLIKSPTYLSSLLINQQQHQRQTSSGGTVSAQSSGNSTDKLIASNRPMLKWIRLNVQVKPKKVSLIVKDAESGALLETQSSADLLTAASFYSLKPNKVYAIQCLVEESRPKSFVSWFNRTVPIALEPIELPTNDSSLMKREFIMPTEGTHHRLSSYTRTTRHAEGTFSTTSTLLLTTNIWDNFEELFCRVSNEAFEFDQLIQVAPIISARLYINYAPLAWLEPSKTQGAGSTKWAPSSPGLRLELGSELNLRCWVAANPLSQNAILQIDWLKDGRKLTATTMPATNLAQIGAKQRQPQQQRQILIERANHLHIPMATQQSQLDFIASANNPQQHSSGSSLIGTTNSRNQLLAPTNGNQLAGSSKLISSSSLTITGLNKADSALYSCQFKLIPAPAYQSQTNSTLTHHQQQQQQPIRITSGQANAGIQVNVVEAKLKAPLIRIQSSKNLLVYSAHHHQQQQQQQQRSSLLVVGEPGAILSLKCDLQNGPNTKRAPSNGQLSSLQSGGAHKVVWYLNGAHLSSSSTTNTHNLTLDRNGRHHLGLITCAHHIPGSNAPAAQQLPSSDSNSQQQQQQQPIHSQGTLMRVYQSANELDLKVRVKPRLLQRRDLMPPIRSFSELELNAKPSGKLSISCLARCEPSLCSIDWLLNGRLLKEAASEQPASKQGQATFPPLDLENSSHQIPSNTFTSERLLQVTTTSTTLGELSFISTETLSRKHNESRRFGWLKTSSLSMLPSIPTSNSESLSGTGLLQELKSDELSANVASKLELTYYQIGQLLSLRAGDNENELEPSMGENGYSPKEEEEELRIKCKLNSVLNQSPPSSSDGNVSPINRWRFARIQPFEWFPPLEDEEQTTKTSAKVEWFSSSLAAGGDQESSVWAVKWPPPGSEKQLNLTALYSQGADNTNGPQEEEEDGDDDLGDTNGTGSSSSSWLQFSSPAGLLSSLSKFSSPSTTSNNNINKQSAKEAADHQQPTDEMQISILRDRAPRGVAISFAGRPVSSSTERLGPESSTSSGSSLTLSESQLLELLDPNKPPPMLQCSVLAKVYPSVQFKWTFTDLNNTEHTLPPIDGDSANNAELNLRHFAEFRQRQLDTNPMSSQGIDLVKGVVGNYTCTSSNIHGSKSVSLPLQIQGRPMCKLRLGSQYLSNENELMVNLVCSIYSSPVLLETVWFKGSQQLATNKSSSIPTWSWPVQQQNQKNKQQQQQQQQPLSNVELPIMILNKQQEFLLANSDPLVSQIGNNFKCVARNSLGYSEPCELRQLDRQSLLKNFKSDGVGSELSLSGKTQSLSMPTSPHSSSESSATSADIGPPLVLKQPMLNFLSNGSSFEQQLSILQQQQQMEQLANNNNKRTQGNTNNNNNNNNSSDYSSSLRNLFGRVDFILVVFCSLALAWALFVVGSVFVRRHFGKSWRGAGVKKSSKHNHNTNWRFNSATRFPAAGSTGTTNRSSLNNNKPFQSKISVNYYGDSNGGDSEHDIIASCSQSSHYEDFVQHQKRQIAMSQQLQQLHQPIYFNPNQRSLISSSTLNPTTSSTTISTATTSRRQAPQTQHYYQHHPQQLQHHQAYSAGPTTTLNNTNNNNNNNNNIINEHIYDDVICNYL